MRAPAPGGDADWVTDNSSSIAPPPSGIGCADCLESGTWWFHLRRCVECGQVGCCDTSPMQHATAHYTRTGHPVMTTFEPEPAWFWDYRTEQYVDGPPPDLAAPLHRPEHQHVPAPPDRVPADWRQHLHL